MCQKRAQDPLIMETSSRDIHAQSFGRLFKIQIELLIVTLSKLEHYYSSLYIYDPTYNRTCLKQYCLIQ